jgi:cytochrome c-type biogenesis protein CcmH/NrfG
MAQTYVTAIAAGITTLGIALLLLRIRVRDRLLLLTLCQRWIAASPFTASFILVPLMAIAASCFASGIDYPPQAAKDLETENTGGSSAAPEFEALRAYASSSDPAATSPKNAADTLPDVDTMIAKLISRLEEDPNDVNGWKMLGWSYLNTNRPIDAAKAYETALKLQPASPEIKNALERASLALNNNAPAPDSHNIGEGGFDAQQSDAVRGMVDGLAARLETSPKDLNGWMRLMSSRVALGETQGAKSAFTKAEVVFANDAVAKTRLEAAARELGLD